MHAPQAGREECRAMGKRSFVMYADYEKHIARLPDEDAGKLIKAILAYVNTGEEVPLSPAADMAFSFMKERIDRDSEKWAATCQKRSEAGKKGMASRWSNNKTKQKVTGDSKEKPSITSDNKAIPPITKITDNDNDNDNDILSLSKANDNIPQDSTALERAALPAPGEEEVIPWDEIDFELV